MRLQRNNQDQTVEFDYNREDEPEDKVRELTDRIEAERRLEEDDNFNKHIN